MRTRFLLLVLLAFVGAATMASVAQAASRRYLVTDLSRLGVVDARGINTAGQITGSVRAAYGRRHAFRYTRGVVTDLGQIGWGLDESGGMGISDAGLVVGWSDVRTSSYENAMMSGNGTMTNLGSLGGVSSAYAANASGDVVGEAFTWANAERYAVLWSNGVMRKLGALGGTISSAADINDQGQIVGMATIETGTQTPRFHAFLYENGAMRDLGTLGGEISVASAINYYGQIVGSATQFGTNLGGAGSRAFVYDHGVMRDLGTLGGDVSGAVDINDLGEIVGVSKDAAGNWHGYIYSSGVMRDLNDLALVPSDWSIDRVWAVNNSGAIVAEARRGNESRPVLLTPFSVAAGSPIERLVRVTDSLASKRASLPTRRSQTFLGGALDTLAIVAEPHRWGGDGSLTLNGDGLTALRLLRTAATRLAWNDANVRDATGQELTELVALMAQIVHARFDQVFNFVGEGGPPNRFLLWRAERHLRDADNDPNRLRATLRYIAAWQTMAGQPPCC